MLPVSFYDENGQIIPNSPIPVVYGTRYTIDGARTALSPDGGTLTLTALRAAPAAKPKITIGYFGQSMMVNADGGDALGNYAEIGAADVRADKGLAPGAPIAVVLSGAASSVTDDRTIRVHDGDSIGAP